MDRLEEIRQRAEAAKAQKEKGDSITAACIAWSIVINDIPYLLAELDRLQARAEAAEAERDAAIADMQIIVESASECNVCKHRVGASGCPLRYKGCKFEWRGQQAGKGAAK